MLPTTNPVRVRSLEEIRVHSLQQKTDIKHHLSKYLGRYRKDKKLIKDVPVVLLNAIFKNGVGFMQVKQEVDSAETESLTDVDVCVNSLQGMHIILNEEATPSKSPKKWLKISSCHGKGRVRKFNPKYTSQTFYTSFKQKGWHEQVSQSAPTWFAASEVQRDMIELENELNPPKEVQNKTRVRKLNSKYMQDFVTVCNKKRLHLPSPKTIPVSVSKPLLSEKKSKMKVATKERKILPTDDTEEYQSPSTTDSQSVKTKRGRKSKVESNVTEISLQINPPSNERNVSAIQENGNATNLNEDSKLQHKRQKVKIKHAAEDKNEQLSANKTKERKILSTCDTEGYQNHSTTESESVKTKRGRKSKVESNVTEISLQTKPPSNKRNVSAIQENGHATGLNKDSNVQPKRQKVKIKHASEDTNEQLSANKNNQEDHSAKDVMVIEQNTEPDIIDVYLLADDKMLNEASNQPAIYLNQSYAAAFEAEEKRQIEDQILTPYSMNKPSPKPVPVGLFPNIINEGHSPGIPHMLFLRQDRKNSAHNNLTEKESVNYPTDVTSSTQNANVTHQLYAGETMPQILIENRTEMDLATCTGSPRPFDNEQFKSKSCTRPCDTPVGIQTAVSVLKTPTIKPAVVKYESSSVATNAVFGVSSPFYQGPTSGTKIFLLKDPKTIQLLHCSK